MQPRWLLLLSLAVAVQSTQLVKAADIPVYKPSIGIERSYRVQKSTETDMSLWFDKPEASSVIMRGDFRFRMIVASQDEKSLRTRWSLSAELPSGITEAPNSFELNAHYGNSLAIYGIQYLDIDTDLSGAPIKLVNADQILSNIQKQTDNLPPESKSTLLGPVLDKLHHNPLEFIVTTLVPEVTLLATTQYDESFTANVGGTWKSSQDVDLSGVSIPVTYDWEVVAIDMDKHTVTFALKETWDSATLTKATAAATDKLFVSFADRVKQLTPEQLATIKSASKNRAIRSVVSLQNGETLEALETVTAHSSGIKLVTKTHIWREDIQPSLASSSSPHYSIER